MIITADTQRTTIVAIHFSPEQDSTEQVESALRDLSNQVTILDRTQTATHTTIFLHTTEEQAPTIINKINSLDNVGCTALDTTFSRHWGGKIETHGRINVVNREELALAY